MSGNFPDMPCVKKVNKHKRNCRSTGQHPRTKNASRPADKPWIKHSSTAGFVPPSVHIGFRLFLLLEKRSGEGGVRGTLVSRANCSVGVQSFPTPPRRLAVRPDPTCPWYYGFWIRQVITCSNMDLDCLRFGSRGFAPVLVKDTCRVQNPDTQRAGRVGTAQGVQRGGATLGRTRCRHFGGLGSRPFHRPSSAM